MQNSDIAEIKKFYLTSYGKAVNLNIRSVQDVIVMQQNRHDILGDYYYTLVSGQINVVSPQGSVIFIAGDKTQSGNISLNDLGTYQIIYSGVTNFSYSYASGDHGDRDQDFQFSFNVSVVENKLPLKKWTVTDVINRLLDLAEPIRSDEKPRFKLNPEQAERFDKILAPELSFTKQTLRECLQEVGRVIHGEPRLEVKKDETGKYYYEVVYDMYAATDDSKIRYAPFVSKSVRHVLDNYAGWLDSSAENLVNQLDKFSGVIAEPYKDGAKTVRTENLYVRITDGNMIIATQYPVYSVDKLEYVYTENGAVKSVDITAWLFEKSIYDSQLSSYSESDYPYSKAYALYYSQGNKNIGGLNFKVPAAVFEAYRNYAIVNILKRAIGSDYELPGGKNPKYPEMCFRVTYTPIYNVRVAQTKAYYEDFKRPAALIYNQQSNVIESRSYGENLKGAIARLGNIEFTKTYMLARFVQIPQAGQKYNDDYYISVVAVEIMPTYIRCTIGLSKDFNRLSAYIGINSSKRYSEISQTQAVERNTLYREYVVIGDSETPDADTVMDNGMLIDIAETFTQAFTEIGTGITPITNVCAWGTTKNGNVVNGAAVNLPVISSAFGNSVSFSWKYEDNYSAGPYAQYAQNGLDGSNDEVDGYFQNNVKYTDYYGRIYYYHFDLQMDGPEITADNLTDTALNLPKGSVPTASSGFASTVGKAPYVMRKDNREALQVNYQIDFVTNRKDIIIGSALASCCPAIRGSDATLKPKLYVFPTELNKFTDHIEGYEDVKLSELPSAEIQVTMQDGYFVVECESFPASGKSWAIVTAQTEAETTVENDDGEPVTQISFTGGDLLIGQNTEVISGQALAPIYFTKKREIFDKTVWKDRR